MRPPQRSSAPPQPPGAPSDAMLALYIGDRDTAGALDATLTLTLLELAAFDDLTRPQDLQDHTPDGWTPLHMAAFFGCAAVVVRLLRAGADQAAPSHNRQGNTALLAANADAASGDTRGYTRLHLSASRGDRAVTELLLACGASPIVRTRDGKLAADIARGRGHPDLADWLSST